MGNLLKYIFAAILMMLSGYSACAQVNKTENKEKKAKEEIDLYKEFDDHSFANATSKIKDSSVLKIHLLGAQWGYGISGVMFSQSSDHKMINSAKNYGIYYTYYHSLLGNMPYFGLQTGVGASELGYRHIIDHRNDVQENPDGTPGEPGEYKESEYRYSAIEIPLVAKFRIDTKWIRVALGVGAFGSYIYDTQVAEKPYDDPNKLGVGIIGQLGFTVKLHPVEVFVEGSYQYTLSHFFNPQIYSSEYWLYTHSNKIMISAGINFVLGKYKNKQ